MKDLYLTTHQNTKEQMFYVQLIADYNLPPIAAKSLVELSRSVFVSGEEDYQSLDPGQIKYYALAIEEPPGKPLRECRYVPVVLTLDASEDMDVYQSFGLQAWRRHVIRRICEEAYIQRAPLTLKDLIRLLKVSYSTVKRDVRGLNKQHPVPTRGAVKDIGPTSHKTRIVDMYLQGYTPTEIARNVYHSLSSVERYITDFARVAILTQRGESIDTIRLIVGISDKLTKEYHTLYCTSCDKYRARMKEITDTLHIHEKAATFKKNRVVT